MTCPHKDTCPLFPVFTNDKLLNVWKTFYCDADHATCERFRRSSEGKEVADSLLPNGTTLGRRTGSGP